MFEPFKRLNADCQLEICRSWMLDYDHEVKGIELRLDSHGSLFQRSRRRAADNTLTLVKKSTHKLFESIVDVYAIYTLEIDGFALDGVAKWANIIPFPSIHLLRLKIDFSRLESWTGPMDVRAPLPSVMTVRAEIDAGLADVTKLLTKFIRLRDLQLITVIDLYILPLRASGGAGDENPRDISKATSWDLRSYLLHNYANTLGATSRKLTAIHVSFVMLQREVDIRRLFEIPVSTKRRLVDISNSTKKRTSLGWRHNLKYFEMSCTRGDTTRLVAAAKEIGLKTERDGSGYLTVP